MVMATEPPPIPAAAGDSALRWTFIVAAGHLPTVGRTVASILDQRAGEILEVLIGGVDRHGVVPHDPRTRFLADMPPGPACRVYNRGLAEARGDWIAFVDGDCVLDPGWLDAVTARQAQGWDLVAGGLDLDGDYWSRAYNLACFHRELGHLPAGPRQALPTMNLACATATARRIGPFREDLARCYDYDWTLRLARSGGRLVFDPAARVRHYPCAVTPGLLWRTFYAGGRCSQVVRRQHAAVIWCPWLFDRPRLTRLAAPLLALLLTLRVLGSAPRDIRMWQALPVLLGTRLAWWLGVSDGRRLGPLSPADYAFRAPPVEAAARPG
jgi:hypothetical protein